MYHVFANILCDTYLSYFAVFICVLYLSQQQPLWFQFQLDLMSLVVQELFQLQVFQSTKGPVISPVHRNLHLPGLIT